MCSDKEIIEACNSSTTMAQAAVKVGLHFNTFASRAKKLGCYKPNQAGRGINKSSGKKIPLDLILNGKYPEYQTFKLKTRLLEEGVLINKCSVCNITEWNGKKLVMELDHINGDRKDHRLKNLRLICPNCHALTETYRAKNIKK